MQQKLSTFPKKRNFIDNVSHSLSIQCVLTPGKIGDGDDERRIRHSGVHVQTDESTLSYYVV